MRDKQQVIQRLNDLNQALKQERQEFEASVLNLTQEQKINQKEILEQTQELKQIRAQRQELQDTLNAKEKIIHELECVGLKQTEKLKKSHSQIQELKKEVKTQGVIIAEIKKQEQVKDNQETKSKFATKDRTEQDKENTQVKIANALLENQLVTEKSLKSAREVYKKYSGSLLQFLFVNRDIEENRLVEHVLVKFGIPYLPLGSYEIRNEIVELLPSEVAEKYWVVPVDKIGENLMVAMVDPFDNTAIKEIEKTTGSKVKVYIGLLSEIAKKIQLFYKVNIRGFDAEGNLVSPIFVDTPQYKGRERRRAVRFKAELPLKIIHDNTVIHSKTRDICWDGISFRLDHELPICSMITVELMMPNSENGEIMQLPVTSLAQVKGITAGKSNDFVIGAKFLKIAKDDIRAIMDYVLQEQGEKEQQASDGSWHLPGLQKMAKLVGIE